MASTPGYAPFEIPAEPVDGLIHQEKEPFGGADRDVKVLLACRDDWGAERTRHRFLLDAYAGTGGFQGKVRLPFRSYWGWAADVYSDDLAFTEADDNSGDSGVRTYLDRFHREEIPKFRRRANMAHYPNHVQTFIDVPLSYMFRRDFAQKPDVTGTGLDDWMTDADGAGNSWMDIVRDTVVPRAATLGWCPVLFDLPSNGTRQATAFDDARNKHMPYVMPLFPSNLLDWNHDDNGVLLWAKVRVDYVDRVDPLELGRDVTRITIWTPEGWAWWELVSVNGHPTMRGSAEGSHPFGRVPIVVMRRKAIPDDPFRGLPMASSASDEARRVFNYISELDEHLRACAFAIFEFPATGEAGKSMTLGAGQGVQVGTEWKNTHRWVTPDPAVSEMYEKRIANATEEMFRIQKMEFTRGTKGGGARSGLSQAFEFEATNRTIAEIARMTARFDQEARRLVSSVVTGPERKTIVTKAPTRFDVEEMATKMDEALSAVSLGLGAIAEAEIKKRVVRSLLPHLDDAIQKRIDDELDELAEEKATQLRESHDGGMDAIRKARQALKGNLDDPEDILDKRAAERERLNDEKEDE